ATAGVASVGVDSSVSATPFVRPTAPPEGPPIDPTAVDLHLVAGGLVAPVGVVVPPDGSGREFVLDQPGTIRIIRNDRLVAEPFLDLTSTVVPLDPTYDERGLLGLAFHPDFATNGRLFVYRGVRSTRTGEDHVDRLSEFRVDPANPDKVDLSSEKVILEFGQPQPNHSGGGLGFGPDGLLYLGVGDGGGAGDATPGHSPQGNAQDLAKLNGKILRIDVDHGTDGRRYAIPSGNPFADPAVASAAATASHSTGPARPEILAYGFRNPWRLSWEPTGAHRLLVSDVGYGRYEEIDVVEPGANDGWRIREGRHCLDLADPLVETTDCATTGPRGEPLVDPVVEYSHKDVGVAVVGGYVYRGSAIPGLAGRYVFADLSKDWLTATPVPNGSLLVADPSSTAGAAWPWKRLAVAGQPRIDLFISGMGEEADGELLVAARGNLGPIGKTGEVLRLVPGG
ncbi:MAG TPA: PQQ-dependent sugar dehydrogenase, partial [Candidatus Limnocylindrales bacterium]|nr:PQQ-dependent sugar dehydrogenase [Candidatus Limnocylindrales bacterium]